MRAIVCLAGVLVLGQLGGGPPEARPLPPVALRAADAGAVPLAYVLARFGVPAGLVTDENPSESAYAPFAAGLAAPVEHPLSAALARLEGRHAQYDVSWSNPVLAIRNRRLRCDAALDTLRLAPTTASADLARLLLMLASLVTDPPGPLRGMLANPPGATSVAPLPSLDFASTTALTLREALDAAVRLNGGGVWIVWQHRRSDTRLGCRIVGFFPNGQAGAAAEDFATLPDGEPR